MLKIEDRFFNIGCFIKRLRSDKQIGKRIKGLERIYGSRVGRSKNSEKNSEISP